MPSKITIRGARVHNLKNINVEIPRDKLVVITGLSGSGKSSLAFDTIYAEGQRRYVESLSSYARQFLGLMDKPDVDEISGLSPAISIDQKSVSHNPRSTVGTVTEIYDYLRLLFARIGKVHCPQCGRSVERQTIDKIAETILKVGEGQKIMLLAPLINEKKGEHKGVLEEVQKAGYARVRFDGQFLPIEEALDLTVDKKRKHTLDVVVDRLIAEAGERSRLTESLETSLELGDGVVRAVFPDEKDQLKQELMFSERLACAHCSLSLPEIEPRTFSFNSPHGACAACTGLGTKLEVDPDLVFPNRRLTIEEGAIRPWSRSSANQGWYLDLLAAVGKKQGFRVDVPVADLSAKVIHTILYGTGEVPYELASGFTTRYEGVVPHLERKYKETESDYVRSEIERCMRIHVCPACKGKRLRPEALAVTVAGRSVADVVAMTIEGASQFFLSLDASSTPLSAREMTIARQVIKEIVSRLRFLKNVGLEYLTLDRTAASLSGGESQRIRLATQIGSSLSGVIYILDEPSIGLHHRDNAKLITTLEQLRDMGNTVVVVEHDEQMMRSADYLIDIGPGAGAHGGEVVAAGKPADIERAKHSLTGQYLAGKLAIQAPARYRSGSGKKLIVRGAREHNLKNIDVEIPLGMFVCITGVSGSGKSTLMTEILAKALAQHFSQAKDLPGAHRAIVGMDNLDKAIVIDQSPIGRTPRSNPATYTGAFTPIRDLYTELPEARMRGYKAGRFSFNVKGGRCEACQGEGLVRIEMQFLPDVYVECEECKGKRYNREALEIHYKGKHISDVLAMTVEEARHFFAPIPAVASKLQTLHEVGLSYITLGQPATTLSGGEAQRVKLAAELSRRSTGRTLYILDEPTTGLHFEDVKKLLGVLGKLVEKGNTVLVIEHNLDVIKCADWIIDLGPDGGEKGGQVVASGRPAEVMRNKNSATGIALGQAMVGRHAQRRASDESVKKSARNGRRPAVTA